MARKHTQLAKSRLLQYTEIQSTEIPLGQTVYQVSSLPGSVDLAKEFIFVTGANKYYRITPKEPLQYASGTVESGILMGEPAVNVASGYEAIFLHAYSPSDSTTVNNGLSVYKPVTDNIELNTGSMYATTAQAVNNFVLPKYDDTTYTTSTPSITVYENTVYRCTGAKITSLTLNISNMVTGPKTRESIIYFHTGTTPSLTITGKNNTLVFGDQNLISDKDYKVLIKDNCVTIIPFVSNLPEVAISGDYTDLTNKPSLNTTLENSLQTNENEILTGVINLHKVSKTGNYSDLSNTPSINDATLTVQKNGTTIDSFSANASQNKTINITVPTTASDVGALPSSTKYGAFLSLSIDSSTYVVTAQLKDQDGNNLGSAGTIDLPLESVVVSGSYNAQTKKVILTLQNGSTIEFSVADLVAGLQSEITAQNPLSADLVTDGTTNKVLTAAEKTKLAGIEAGAEVNVQSDWNQSDNTADDFIKNKPTIPTKLDDLEDVFVDNFEDYDVLVYSELHRCWENGALNTVAFTGNYNQLNNKPNLANVATSGDYDDLTNKPTIPAAQVNADWNATSGAAEILNKPTLTTVTFRYW